MEDMSDLSSRDIKAFRRRYHQARLGMAAVALAVGIVVFVAPFSFAETMALFFGAGVLCFLLECRGQRCPGCQGWVWWSGEQDAADRSAGVTPGISLLCGPPEHCRGCGVRLDLPKGGPDCER
jgi:hypothetical protein